MSNKAGSAFPGFPESTTILSLFPAYTSVITPTVFNGAARADSQLISGSDIVAANPTATGSGVWVQCGGLRVGKALGRELRLLLVVRKLVLGEEGRKFGVPVTFSAFNYH